MIGLIGALLCACTSGAASPAPTSDPVSSAPTMSSPAPSTPVSTSPTGPLTTGPNVRPGEKPPVLPAIARQKSANGAVYFAAYYIKAFDWSLATNDAYLLTRLVLPSCTGCAKTIGNIDRLATKRETLHGGRISIKSISIDHDRFPFKADYVVDVEANESSVTITGPSATTTPDGALADDHSLLFLQWQQSQWKVAEVGSK